MLTAVVRRISLSLLILFLVAVFVFLATEVLPGDALDVYLTADDVSVMSEEDIERMRRDLGTGQTCCHAVLCLVLGCHCRGLRRHADRSDSD